MPETRSAHLHWQRNMEFIGHGTHPVTAGMTVDGDGNTGPSPMIALLLACAGCSASDVVSILEKMRVELSELTVDITGTRRDEAPKRYVRIQFRFRMGGAGMTREKAQRAVDLSLEKYCSVVHSLASDIAITSEIEIV